METRPLALTLALTLTLTLTLVLAAPADPPSPSPSPISSPTPAPAPAPLPSPGPSRFPPKQMMNDPTVSRPSPQGNLLNFPPSHLRPSCPSERPNCHRNGNRQDLPGAVAAPPDHGRKLNFGEMMGLVLAGVALALQVALGGFLVYKRRQFRKAEQREIRGVVSSSSSVI